MPPGKLTCTHNDKRYKWYISNPHKTYLPKSQQKLAEQLAYKRYLLLRLDEYENELNAINNYLLATSHPSKSDSLLLECPEFARLLTPYFTPLKQELSDWMKQPYEKNPNYPEALIHKSISGNLLRSKSEAIIDMLLYQNKIPYRYECALQIGNKKIFPDFKIRHPLTGKRYYWEHFGQMDVPKYYNKACSKINLYVSNGYVPSINLITTYETENHPLTTEEVNRIIHTYFL